MNPRRITFRRGVVLSLICLTATTLVGNLLAGASVPPSRHHSHQKRRALAAPACSSTTPISSGPVPLSGSISDPSAPPACFTFNDITGDTVFINAVATSTNPTPSAVLLDPNGTQLSPEGANSYDTDADGIYTIEVSDTAAGPFNVDIEQMAQAAGCTTIKFGDPAMTSDISQPGAFWCLQFKVRNEQWTSSSFGSVPAPMAELFYGGNGYEQGGGFDIGSGGGLSGLTRTNFGVQTVLIFPWYGSSATGPVTITIGDLQVSPPSARPGALIDAFGAGFTRGEPFHVVYETGLTSPATRVLCDGLVPKNLEPNCYGRIPKGKDAGPAGPHLVTMTGLESGHVGKVSFDLER